jgi:hypothetical protein
MIKSICESFLDLPVCNVAYALACVFIIACIRSVANASIAIADSVHSIKRGLDGYNDNLCRIHNEIKSQAARVEPRPAW